jgi:hypothetical protein
MMAQQARVGERSCFAIGFVGGLCVSEKTTFWDMGGYRSKPFVYG